MAGRQLIRDVAIVIGTFALLAALVFPFLWVVITSIRPDSEVFSRTFELLPRNVTLANYADLAESKFFRYILNSIFISSSATFLTVVLATLAGYAFSRYKFRARGTLVASVAFTQLFPFIILITPIYVTFWKLGLVNTYAGIVIAYVAITLPFSIYMLLSYFQSVPKELDEAAAIDGCTALGVIFRVVLPVAWPGLVATAVYAFVQTWNEFLFALTLLTDDRLKTVPVGLASFFGEYTTDWGNVTAASVLATAPTLIFFLIMQRHLVAGLAAGSVKQ
jgi:ABC-type glycerol-3-phosphate transport system permease component